jgi:hypothetical protein
MSAVLIACCTLFSCSERATDPNADGESSLYQVHGCIPGALYKNPLADSCFAFRFEKSLALDFCLPGNCCPDSNRYFLSHRISRDTLIVTAVDTAGNMCRCNCSYLIHADIAPLPLDRYHVFCFLADSLMYRVEVTRSPF